LLARLMATCAASCVANIHTAVAAAVTWGSNRRGLVPGTMQALLLGFVLSAAQLDKTAQVHAPVTEQQPGLLQLPHEVAC
jgi:hypothetical protein